MKNQQNIRYSWSEGWHDYPEHDGWSYCVENGRLVRWYNANRGASGSFYRKNADNSFDRVHPKACKRNINKYWMK